MAQDWLEVSVVGLEQQADSLEQWLFDAGALSVTLSDAVDDDELTHAVLEPVPGEVRLWADITLVGLFAQNSDKQQVRDALELAAQLSSMPQPVYRMKRLKDQVWERTWMDTFKPMRFGHKLWICPTQAEPVEPDAVTLRLDPGMAFGTGTHATTAQCLTWLGEQTVNTMHPLKGKTVIDYGCGSGVLAIASLLLGANHVWAIDIDPQALLATRENAQLNGVLERMTVGPATIVDNIKADVILANILFQPLMELADTLSGMVQKGGSLVMSGILEEQMEPLRMRYNDSFEFVLSQSHDGWALMAAVRR